MSKRELVALLPMKANSERVPSKNFRSLAGRPMFRWMLDALLCIEEISCVVINTDARERLSDLCLDPSERVVIRDRRQELCGDFTSMNLIIEDDIRAVPAQDYLMTHTTNPLVRLETFKEALSTYRRLKEEGIADSLFGVTRVQTRLYRPDGSPVNHNPEILIRTQDLEPWFEENSTMYLFSEQSFREAGNARIGKRPALWEVPKPEAVDIDTAEDWWIAEALLKHRRETEAINT